MHKWQFSLLLACLSSLLACAPPNALPNLPVTNLAKTEVNSASMAKVQLQFPFQPYKMAYMGFYPDDILLFQIYTSKASSEGAQVSAPVFEETLNPQQLPDQLRFSAPLQVGQTYFFKLVLRSTQMPCGGNVLDGQIKPSSANQTFVLESPQLEVNSDLPTDPAFSDHRPVSGFVRNAQGKPVAGVQVQLKNTPTALDKTLSTDSRGYFVWGHSPLGTEITITVRPASGASLEQRVVPRRLDDTGSKRGVCDPSLNQVEFDLP